MSWLKAFEWDDEVSLGSVFADSHLHYLWHRHWNKSQLWWYKHVYTLELQKYLQQRPQCRIPAPDLSEILHVHGQHLWLFCYITRIAFFLRSVPEFSQRNWAHPAKRPVSYLSTSRAWISSQPQARMPEAELLFSYLKLCTAFLIIGVCNETRLKKFISKRGKTIIPSFSFSSTKSI